ncbi:hypothetical protein OO013_09705 [Mangrovivirga sp. M17]|uniref:Uncharacterized protein n=1 Tax=Mangrovivirga halotolerans TaxID=2993936 RepID=A0ABT3RRN6_9BACT|nr:hypothetical protein [Mangrovivirga halotolerans]MCX2744141.1 hypothetical protein [Mangrovivirga halotolerans]
MNRAFILVLILFINFSLVAQRDNSSLKTFEIKIEKDGNEIKLECQNGCSWEKLNFTINENVFQKIDKNGMVGLRGDSLLSGTNYNKFLFAIAQTGNEVDLIGLKGMAWKKLHISLRPHKSQLIDEYGLVPGNK